MDLYTTKLCRYDYDRSWCSCTSDVSCNHLGDRLQCNCGEEWKIFEWNWENDSAVNNVVLSNDNRDVIFHPVYSSGTAAVKGQQQLKPNVHYYWEIKMLTNLYGTDIMIGVGTSKVVLSDWKLRFCSMLGYDSESWGYSYTGKIQHGRLTCNYGSRYNLGSLIGVHLDMCAGTLEYYLNRKPLGIAFRGLKNQELYPMVSSTAAQSAMRITCALSQVPTLQIECLKIISNNIELLKQYWSVPGLSKMIGKKYFWLIPELPPEEPIELSFEDQMLLPTGYFFDRNYFRRKRFCKGLHLGSPQSDISHVNYHKLLHAKQNCNKAIVRCGGQNILRNNQHEIEGSEDNRPGCSNSQNPAQDNTQQEVEVTVNDDSEWSDAE